MTGPFKAFMKLFDDYGDTPSGVNHEEVRQAVLTTIEALVSENSRLRATVDQLCAERDAAFEMGQRYGEAGTKSIDGLVNERDALIVERDKLAADKARVEEQLKMKEMVIEALHEEINFYQLSEGGK